jgi:ubiquinone/menaquinone biosynthesis C-methylase UbiE
MPGTLSDRFWGPLFARGYDRFIKGTEDAGLRDQRRSLLARAEGRTLEIGAGTGTNLSLYPESVSELVLTEPDPHMRRQLERKAPIGVKVIDASAEQLPFPDGTFDTAVATLVFCTIPNPQAALSEIARVLKGGGRLLFLEHVRAGDPKAARWQDRLERPWGWFGRGCHPNRDTLATIGASPLEVIDTKEGSMPKAPAIVEPLITGEARRVEQT